MTGTKRTALLTVLLTALTASIACAAAPGWHGTVEEVDGWTEVRNPAHPLEGDRILRPHREWRIGDDEDAVLFGLIEDARVAETGEVYLLDTVLSSIYIVAPDGKIVRSLEQEGDGPGEFRMARELVFLPDGALGILEMMPGKIVSLSRDGVPRPSFALDESGGGGMNHLQHIAVAGGKVLIGSVSTSFGDEVVISHSLTCHDGDGSRIAVIQSAEEVQTGGNVSIDFGGGDNAFTSRFSFCDDGRVVIFPDAAEYRMDVYDTEGNRHMRIRREYERVRKSDETIAEIKLQNEAMAARFGGGIEMTIEEMADDISGVIARPDGSLWVANSRGGRERPEGTIGWFDVYDRDGRYVERIGLEADYDPERDNYAVRGDRLFVFKEAQKAPARSSTMGGGGGMMVVAIGGNMASEEDDEDEEIRPYEVICYRLGD